MTLPNHVIMHDESGRCRCTVCGGVWKSAPTGACPGVPVYVWGQWPEHLLTKRQMGEAGFQTGQKLPAPAGAVYRSKSPGGIMWLYDRYLVNGDWQSGEDAKSRFDARIAAFNRALNSRS